MSDLKIAFVTTSDLSTTQGSTEAAYVSRFLASENDVHIYSPQDPAINGATWQKLPDSSVVPAFILYNILLAPYFIYKQYQFGYDIIYTYKGFHLTPYIVSIISSAKWIADFQTKPTGQAKEWSNISGEMDILEWSYYSVFDLAYRFTLPNAHAVIGLSKSLCDHLNKKFGVPCEKLHLVPLGVDTEHFRPGDWEKPPKEPIDIVYLGSISPRRGLETVLSVLSSSKLQIGIQFHLIGSGSEEYEQQLREQIISAGIETKVTWHGYVDHGDLPDRLLNMDAAISPLPNHDSYEISSPAKIYEYLALGLPVICTDIRAHRTVLTDCYTGFFYQPESESSLVDILNKLADLEDGEWETTRQSARETALENDWSVRLEKIRLVIEDETRD